MERIAPKSEEGAVVHVCHILSFGKISLLARLFYPFFPIFTEKMKKKVFNILKFDSFEWGANYKIVISGAIAQLGER